MSEMIRTANASYNRYEELLLRKNELKKEGFLLEQKYIRTFGEYSLAVFKVKVECAKKIKNHRILPADN